MSWSSHKPSPTRPDDITAEKLGITETGRSPTPPISAAPAPNASRTSPLASAHFHGLLVPPGQTFSMASALGDVSLDNGYAEALIIFGDRTIKGVGGGVCQVSTTLFRTVFFGGYPIDERYAHAYRVGYYEQTANGARSKTWPGWMPPCSRRWWISRFTNDTPYWLLMETYVSASNGTLTWKFYSTSDGRTVEWQTSGPHNIVEPPEPFYEENPELSEGTIKQVDWAADGADVTRHPHGLPRRERAAQTIFSPPTTCPGGPSTSTDRARRASPRPSRMRLPHQSRKYP